MYWTKASLPSPQLNSQGNGLFGLGNETAVKTGLSWRYEIFSTTENTCTHRG